MKRRIVLVVMIVLMGVMMVSFSGCLGSGRKKFGDLHNVKSQPCHDWNRGGIAKKENDLSCGKLIMIANNDAKHASFGRMTMALTSGVVVDMHRLKRDDIKKMILSIEQSGRGQSPVTGAETGKKMSQTIYRT